MTYSVQRVFIGTNTLVGGARVRLTENGVRPAFYIISVAQFIVTYILYNLVFHERVGANRNIHFGVNCNTVRTYPRSLAFLCYLQNHLQLKF